MKPTLLKFRKGEPLPGRRLLAELAAAQRELVHATNALGECAYRLGESTRRLTGLTIQEADPEVAAAYDEIERLKANAYEAVAMLDGVLREKARQIAQQTEQTNDGARLP
jgi:hypothetical protein